MTAAEPGLVAGEARYRVGLRVADVATAAVFYAGLGFHRVAHAPGPDGPLMAILRGATCCCWWTRRQACLCRTATGNAGHKPVLADWAW